MDNMLDKTSSKCFACGYKPDGENFNRLYLVYPHVGYVRDNIKPVCIKCLKNVYIS